MRLICTKTIDDAIDRMLGMVERAVRCPGHLGFVRAISVMIRAASKMHRHNAMVKKKLYLLSYQAGRDHVMRYLGGEKKLAAWERRKASEIARIAASHRKQPPKWWLDKHHARLKARAERVKHFARPEDWHERTYKGTPEFALQPIKRGPSILRGCSLARRAARPPHGARFLPTIFFVPSELRPELRNDAQSLTPARIRPDRQRASRSRAPKIAATRGGGGSAGSGEAVIWEHISAQDAIAEIFGAPQARGSPSAA